MSATTIPGHQETASLRCLRSEELCNVSLKTRSFRPAPAEIIVNTLPSQRPGRWVPAALRRFRRIIGRRRRSGLNWRWGTLGGAKPYIPRPTLARESSWKTRASTPNRLPEPVLPCGFRNCGSLVSHQNSVVLVAEPRWHVAQLIRASMPVRASCSLIVPSILIISRAISFLSISSDARSPST